MTRLCENCGKILNPRTLICDACGTDYNEKPKCEHFYTKYHMNQDIKHCAIRLELKCERCGETTVLNISEYAFDELATGYTTWFARG